MHRGIGRMLIRWLHGRRFAYGPATSEYTHRVLGNFYVQPGQYALSLRWDTTENSRDVLTKVGPVGVWLTIARRQTVASWTDTVGCPWTTRRLWRGREIHAWLNWKHIGVCFEHDRSIKVVRLEVGPFGAVRMPP